jgi:hypothetical protein
MADIGHLRDVADLMQCFKHSWERGCTFKLLDGGGRGLLNDFVPTITEPEQSITRQSKVCEIVPALDFRDTSKQYDRSIGGQIPVVWNMIPQELTLGEGTDEWQKKTKNCQRFLTGKKLADLKPKNVKKISASF